jgi:hypothetical protein
VGVIGHGPYTIYSLTGLGIWVPRFRYDTLEMCVEVVRTAVGIQLAKGHSAHYQVTHRDSPLPVYVLYAGAFCLPLPVM